jgi:hypothetical protein
MIKAGFDAAENSPAIKAVKEWASPVPRSQQ